MAKGQNPLSASGRIAVPLTIAGEYTSGDPAQIPDGYTRLAQNVLLRPNRTDARPPSVYDNLDSVTGLGYWDDTVNNIRRFVAFQGAKIFQKAVGAETWDVGTTVSGLSAQPISQANFRGSIYYLVRAGNVAEPRLLPNDAGYYSGVTSDNAPWNAPASLTATSAGASSGLLGRSLAVFDSRIFIADAIGIVTNNIQTAGHAYDQTTGWTLTNVTVKNITNSTGAIVCRVFPTSTSVNGSKMVSDESYSHRVGACGLDVKTVWRWDMRGTDAQLTSVRDTNIRGRPSTPNPVAAPGGAIPVTLEAYIQFTRPNTTAITVGAVITSGGFRFRCTVAGTTAGAPPVFNTAKGTTTAETSGTVVWLNEGDDTLASQEYTIPSISEVQTWSTVVLPFTVPARTNTVNVYPRLKFWNGLYSSLPSLTAIDVSLKDGKADGDPAKRNYGFQTTIGGFAFPFLNIESGATATIPVADVVWTEVNDASTISATNTENLPEVSGQPTAIINAGNRLIVFKRFAYWVFAGTGDADVVILPEVQRNGIGCVSPTALAVLDDEVIFIADREIYRLKVGYEPRPICGDAMREEIMAHGSNWVELQSTYNLPLVAVDERHREVWVYTQKGKLYVYHIGDEATPAVYRPYVPEKGQWTTIDIQGQQIQAMAYNQQTGKMEISLAGKGLVRLDDTTSLKDVIDNTATQYSASCTIIFKPIEQYAPRFDAIVESIGVYHTATASQTGQTLTAYISTDRGATYPNSISVQFDPAVERIDIPIWAMGPSVTLKLVYTGAIGPQAFAISRAEAIINVKRGEYPQSLPTQLAGANL